MTDKITSDAQCLAEFDSAYTTLLRMNGEAAKPDDGLEWQLVVLRNYLASRLASPPAGWVIDEAMIERALSAWRKVVRRPDGGTNKSAIRAALIAAAPGAADGAQGDLA